MKISHEQNVLKGHADNMDWKEIKKWYLKLLYIRNEQLVGEARTRKDKEGVEREREEKQD